MLKLLVSDLWTLPWTVMVIEILGPSPMLKLLVTDLWTLFCNIMFIVYTPYVGELQSLNFYHHVQCCM